MMKKPPLILTTISVLLVISCTAINGLVSKNQDAGAAAPTMESATPEGVQPAGEVLTETEGPSVQETVQAEIPGQNQPRPLYFLVDGSVWRSEGGLSEPVRITPQDARVTAFDVWPGDGRLVFAIQDGRIFSVLPGGSPELITQVGSHPAYPAFVSEMDWAPKGDSLAYTVRLDGQGQGVYADYPTPPTGLWVINIYDRNPVWIKSSHYLASMQDDINQIRVLGRPLWSPDGMAIMLTDGYYEWANIDWIFPVQYTEDDSNFHPMPKNPEGNLQAFMNGAWMPDGRSLIVSGEMYSQFGSLVWVDRATGETKPLIDGQTAGLYIFEAQAVPDAAYLPGSLAGIHTGPNRFVYLANCAACGEGSPARLYVADFVDGYLQGQPIGPEKLCALQDSFGNANDARKIYWAPDFSRGVLICGPNEMQLLEMTRESFTLTDITPNLPPRPENDTPVFIWGE